MNGLPGDDTAPLVQSWGVTKEATPEQKADATKFTHRHVSDEAERALFLQMMGIKP